jgi:septal ring factor EnvC (AmiA/AmiB activator)
MNIIYQDEYGSGVYWGASTHPANIGDTVIVDAEEYRVKSRIFYPQEDKIVITVSQGSYRAPVAESSSDNGRLNQLNAAIINTNKRIDDTEKKNRALNEQIVSVKKHINRRIQQDKKDPQ